MAAPALPNLTPAERMARSEEKRQALLRFLASGETWTTSTVAARIWSLSPQATHASLRAMARDRLLVADKVKTGPRAVTMLWGITPDGIAECIDAAPTTAEYQIGRVAGANIPHTVCLQLARIKAESAGWTDWTPGAKLYSKGYPVVPDAVGARPDGKRVAIEIERNVKSAKRRQEVLSGHVLNIAQNKLYTHVLYLCDARCRAERLKALYLSLDEMITPAGRAKFEDAHRARFNFINIEDFKG
jgi:hypothetical protein